MAVPAFITEVVSEVGEWEDRAWFPPGPTLAVCLSGDKGTLADLSDTELLEMAAAARRQTSWAQAQELAAIAELSQRRSRDERDGDPDYRVLTAHESVVEEVATALTVTGEAAAKQVHLAERLTTDLVGTREALEAGRLDLPRVRAICEISDGLSEGLAERLEAAVLERAPFQTTAQLRRRAKRIVNRLAPKEVEERKKAAIAERRLELWETPCGTADLALMDLAPEDAHAIFNKITAAARGLKDDGDDRPLSLIRADLATELLRGAPLPEAITKLLASVTEPSVPTEPVVEKNDHFPAEDEAVVVDPVDQRDDALLQGLAAIIARRLTALTDQVRAAGRLDALPDLVGSAVQAMHDHLAPSREAWCINTGPESEGHGHPGYRPPAALRRLIESRHATCVFPTCNRRSDCCDLDHTTAYGEGAGITCRCNLAPLCRRHHRTKQTPGWKLLQLWPGLLVWITPSGTWHITLPDRQ